MSDLCIICLEQPKYSYLSECHRYECYQCKNYICYKCNRYGGYIIYNVFVCSMNCIFNIVGIDAYFSIPTSTTNYFSVYDLHERKYITDHIKKEQIVIWNKIYTNVITGIIDKYIIKD